VDAATDETPYGRFSAAVLGLQGSNTKFEESGRIQLTGV